MALTSLKNDLSIENEDIIKAIGLNEELEKLKKKYNNGETRKIKITKVE